MNRAEYDRVREASLHLSRAVLHTAETVLALTEVVLDLLWKRVAE